MDLSVLLNTDTVKLTLIPGVLVLLVLFFWFKRSHNSKKSNQPLRSFGRAPNSRHDTLDIATAVAEADQEVRLGQGFELDELADEIIASEQPELADASERYAQSRARRSGSVPPRYSPLATSETKKVVIVDEGLDEPVVAPRVEPVMPSRSYEAPKPAVTTPFTPTPKAAPPVQPTPAFYNTQESVDESLDDEPRAAHSVAVAEPASHPEDDLVLVLNVVVGSGRQLRGSLILKALTATGLTYGAMNVFHYLSPHSPGKPLFSVANMVEPGCFNLSSMEELATPGLTLFANVARPEEGITTFNAMLEVAKKLADYLDATVCDERRGTLSKQRIEHIHGQIREHQRRARLTQLSHA